MAHLARTLLHFFSTLSPRLIHRYAHVLHEERNWARAGQSHSCESFTIKKAMQSSKILLVAEETPARESLAEVLTKHGLTVIAVETSSAALDALWRDCAAVVLLEIMAHAESAVSLCRRLRASGCSVPVIIISGRAELVDRVLALEMGADDYIVKPFDPRELLARIGVQLRRQIQRGDLLGSGRSPLTCRFGPFELDTVRHQLVKAGAQVVLTRAGFAVLEALVRRPKEPLSRELIYKITHRQRAVSSPRSVDVLIARLRRLLEEDVRKPRYIRTVWGIGYAFFPCPEEQEPAPGSPAPNRPGVSCPRPL